MTINFTRVSVAAALAVALVLSASAVSPTALAASDGALTVLINGQLPGDYCIAGPITVSGSGTTGGQGSTWHLVVKWGDGSPDTTSDNTPTLITSGSVAAKNSAFTFSTAHNFTSGSTSGLTVILYHVQPSGQDGQVVVINQCVAAPTEGVVVLAKHVVNDNAVQTGTASADDFTLSIGGEEFEGSEIGAAPGATLTAGNYTITEEGPDGYTRTGTTCVDTSNNSVVSTDGSITVVAGKNYKCTVTNNDAAPVYGTLEVIKNVVNTGGGFKTASNFLISIFDEAEAKVAEAYGSVDGVEHSLLVGDYSVEEVEDSHYNASFSGACTSGSVTLTQAGAVCTVTNTFHNSAPVANDDAFSTDEDTVLSTGNVLTNDTDGQNDSMSAAVVSQPAHGALSFNSDGTFTYTPEANYNGTDSFTYQAIDLFSGMSNTATVTITVNPVNDGPIALSDTYNTNEDTVLDNGNVLDNDSDIDGDTLTVSNFQATSTEDGVVVVNPDGSFSYTPAADFNGEDTFTYTVSDGHGAEATATVTINVSGDNDAPEAADDEYTVDEDGTLTIDAPGVLANDDDTDEDSLTAELVGEGPAHGTLELNDDGSFIYTPDADFNGTDSFTYCANDGSVCSSTLTVTITVDPINDAPVAEDDEIGTQINVPVMGAAVATDVDGDDLTFTVGSTTANGVLEFFTTGLFTYTPDINFTGSDFFTFFANDGEEDSNEGIITIDVSGSPENTLELCSDEDDNDNDDLVDMEDPDCAPFMPRLTLEKVVIGGSDDVSATDWTLTASSTATLISGATGGAAVTNKPVMPGTYTISEEGPDRYVATMSCTFGEDTIVGGTEVTLEIGDNVVCTLTNRFTPFSSDLSVTKTVDDSTADVGQSVTYTITVTNAGPDAATNVVVTDDLPEGLTYVSNDKGEAYNPETGVWTVGSLTSEGEGSSATITIVATVTGAEGQNIENTASAASANADDGQGPNSAAATVTVNTPASNGGGGGGGGGSRRSSGEVLGASTGEVLGVACGLYMDRYMKLGGVNDEVQVIKLQAFLNTQGLFNRIPTAIYDQRTANAVKDFQEKYFDDILKPWGLTAPTGLTYLTTLYKINMIQCPALTLKLPPLTPWTGTTDTKAAY